MALLRITSRREVLLGTIYQRFCHEVDFGLVQVQYIEQFRLRGIFGRSLNGYYGRSRQVPTYHRLGVYSLALCPDALGLAYASSL